MWIDDDLPGLDYEITSEQDDSYNCIAWAAGYDDRWWSHQPGYYWIGERGADAQFLVELFRVLGYEECAGYQPEPGYEKVALYARDGEWTHAARQLESGRWTSKLGMFEGRGTYNPQRPEWESVRRRALRHEKTAGELGDVMARRTRRRSSASAEGVQTPMQPVEKPILCSPYEEPREYWLYDLETGEANPVPGPAPGWALVQDGPLSPGPAGPAARRGELGRAGPRQPSQGGREAVARLRLPKRHQRHAGAAAPLVARGQAPETVLLPVGGRRDGHIPRRDPHGRQAHGFQAQVLGRRPCQAGRHAAGRESARPDTPGLQDGHGLRQDGRDGDAHRMGVLQTGASCPATSASHTPPWSSAPT